MIGLDLELATLVLRGAGGPPPPLSLDFVQGRYGRGVESTTTFTELSGVSFSRSGAGTAPRADGGVTGFATEVPRVTNLGLLLEVAATNRCTVHGANPDAALTGMTKAGAAAATLTRVSVPTGLATAGLASVATSGFVFRLDNSAGTAVATVTVAGATGSTGAHAFSAWIGGGTGWIGRSGTVCQVFGASGVMRRVVGANLAASIATTLMIQADTGQVVDFLLPQLEIGTATWPIVTAGATATRGADSAAVVVPAGCTTWTATYGEGLSASGAVTPGASFDLVAGRPWVGGDLKTLIMN